MIEIAKLIYDYCDMVDDVAIVNERHFKESLENEPNKPELLAMYNYHYGKHVATVNLKEYIKRIISVCEEVEKGVTKNG